ncbi:TPA: replication initiation protein [Neisseria meningitidis]|nr:replication initiation protein [Neisseria meningitidis]
MHFLMEIEKRFTVYEIEQVAQLSSGYAMRLYEFFMQYFDKQTGKGWLEVSLVDLRFRFGLLPNEYARIGNFKTRVIDYSINEINKKTDLTATYEQRKNGRVITGFRFEFTRKQQQ